MEFFQPYLNFWKNYANFSDRTSVRGYWMAFAVNFIVVALLSLIASRLIISLYSLVSLIPDLAINVRRLRDGGRKWTWILISLIPLVGAIILIVLLCAPSAPDDGVPVV